jgi:integrase
MDEGAIDVNPVRKVPPPRRRVDPEQVFTEAKRRALTPEEAGRLLACFPLFWWDHMVTLLGTGLRFGELAGLRRRRVHLGRALPVLEVGPTRYQAGRFGSGFKPRPKSDAGIRPVPLAPLVVEAIRRQLPPGSDPARRWPPARRPARRSVEHVWSSAHSSGHHCRRPWRATRRWPGGRRRPGRDRRVLVGGAGRP